MLDRKSFAHVYIAVGSTGWAFLNAFAAFIASLRIDAVSAQNRMHSFGRAGKFACRALDAKLRISYVLQHD